MFRTMASIKPVKLAFKVFEPVSKENKTEIILIHGISSSKHTFDEVANEIANETRRTIYSLDMRNHGDSEHSDVFTIRSMTEDVLHFMDEHNIKLPTILGHSMGGKIAIDIALTYPQRIESIIVEDFTPKGISCDLENSYSKIMKLWSESLYLVPQGADIEKASKIISANVFTNKPENALINVKIQQGKQRLLPLVQKDGKYVWKTNFKVVEKVETLKFTENSEGLYENPALFLYGINSEFNVDNDKDFILKLFPKAQFNGLSTSHLVHYDAPKEFIEAVTKFLQYK